MTGEFDEGREQDGREAAEDEQLVTAADALIATLEAQIAAGEQKELRRRKRIDGLAKVVFSFGSAFAPGGPVGIQQFIEYYGAKGMLDGEPPIPQK